MRTKLISWVAVAVMLVFTALPVMAATNWDGYYTNLLLKGYLGGPKGDTMDNMTLNYWKFNGASGSSIFNILTGNLKVGNETPSVTLNGEDAYIEGTLEVDGAVRFDGSSLTLRGIAYTLPSADGTNGQQLTTNGSGTLTWASPGSSTAWDDISNPDANKTITFGTYTTTLTGAHTAADGFTIQNTGDFGDISILKVQQTSGNPTNGTVLEVISADTDADALLVTANSINSIQVYGSGNVDIIGGTGVLNYTDFDVSADGAITLACDDGGSMITLTPSAAAVGIDASNATLTNAIDVGANTIAGTTAVIDFTNFDVDASGNVTAVNGVFSGNVSVTGTFQQDAISAKTAATTLTVDGTGAGGVTIGGTSTGTVTLGGGATLVNLPSTVDLVLAGGDLTVTDTANADMVVFTNNTLTTADLVTLSATGTRTSDNVIEIIDGATTASTVGITANAMTEGTAISITANAMTSGYGVSYSSSGAVLTGAAFNAAVTDGAGFTGSYFRAYDGAAEDFAVKRYGATTIAGNASTDVLTITAGDIQVTAGDIDVDRGFITIDNDQDEANYIKRNFAGAGTGPALTVEETHASSTNQALYVKSAGTAGTALKIDQTGTGNATALQIAASGDYPIIDIDAAVARDGDVIDILMTNMVDERALNITGAWTGATGEGLIEVNTTAAVTIPAGQLLRLDQNGTGQHAAAIDGSVIYAADAATAPGVGTSYAVTIDATNIEALHVKTGVVQVDENITATGTITATGGLTVNEDVLVSLDAADEEVTIQNSATDMVANTAVLVVKGTAAGGQTNASYLLSLDRNADGDAQDNFIVMRDNAYTDVKFKVDSGGATTVAGLLTASSGLTLTGATNLTAAVLSGATPLILDGNTTDGTNRVAVSVTDPTAARTLTVPDATGTVKLNCTATHDYAAGADDWTLNVAEKMCSFITVSNASGAVNAYVPAAVPGQQYLIYNGSGATLTFKVTGQTGGTIANGKYGLYVAHATDVIEIFEQP